MATAPTEYKTPKKGYGGRPMWQWVLLYVIIGGVIYYLAYAFFFKGNGYGGDSSGSTDNSYQY